MLLFDGMSMLVDYPNVVGLSIDYAEPNISV